MGTEEQLVAVATKLFEMALPIAAAAKPPPRAAEDASTNGSDGPLPKFVLARLKNRYSAPLFNGYRDGLYSILIDGGLGAWVICEVQLHLAAVLSHKEILHKYYEYFRAYFVGDPDSVQHRMELLEHLEALLAKRPAMPRAPKMRKIVATLCARPGAPDTAQKAQVFSTRIAMQLTNALCTCLNGGVGPGFK